MAGRHLAVDEDEAGVAQMADQRDEADLEALSARLNIDPLKNSLPMARL